MKLKLVVNTYLLLGRRAKMMKREIAIMMSTLTVGAAVIKTGN